jgi:hypothetical protein
MKNRVALTLTDPYTIIVSITFQKLKRLCRFEKAGCRKESRNNAKPKTAPKSKKANKNHF